MMGIKYPNKIAPNIRTLDEVLKDKNISKEARDELLKNELKKKIDELKDNSLKNKKVEIEKIKK
jgi:cell division protein FtsX